MPVLFIPRKSKDPSGLMDITKSLPEMFCIVGESQGVYKVYRKGNNQNMVATVSCNRRDVVYDVLDKGPFRKAFVEALNVRNGSPDRTSVCELEAD